MLGVKADCGGDWGERVERIGGGEELGGGAEREHAPRVASRSRWTATGSLQASPFACAEDCQYRHARRRGDGEAMRVLSSIWATIAVLAASSGAAGSIAAQELHGVVVGPEGAPIPGVVVVLLDSASSAAARALTDATGAYRLR